MQRLELVFLTYFSSLGHRINIRPFASVNASPPTPTTPGPGLIFTPLVRYVLPYQPQHMQGKDQSAEPAITLRLRTSTQKAAPSTAPAKHTRTS